MEAIAIFNNGQIIYWNSILIALGILSGFFISLAFYLGKNTYGIAFYIYYPLACILSVVFSHMLHWYCNMEQYDSFAQAMKDMTEGGYLLPGVLFATWLPAMLFQLCHLVKSRFRLLDALAPGLAFVIAMIKFSDIFTDLCRSKKVVENPRFQKLPFAILMTNSNGESQYRLATFFLTFLGMLLVFGLLCAFYFSDGRREKKSHLSDCGNTYRMFLAWYGAVEIVMDSTRYDAAHLFIPGKALANLNKGAGFMGLSQLIGALCCVYVLIYYAVKCKKAKKRRPAWIILLILFILGLITAGICEYMVQRHISMFNICFALQTLGSLTMASCCYGMYRLCR